MRSKPAGRWRSAGVPSHVLRGQISGCEARPSSPRGVPRDCEVPRVTTGPARCGAAALPAACRSRPLVPQVRRGPAAVLRRAVFASRARAARRGGRPPTGCTHPAAPRPQAPSATRPAGSRYASRGPAPIPRDGPPSRGDPVLRPAAPPSCALAARPAGAVLRPALSPAVPQDPAHVPRAAAVLRQRVPRPAGPVPLPSRGRPPVLRDGAASSRGPAPIPRDPVLSRPSALWRVLRAATVGRLELLRNFCAR